MRNFIRNLKSHPLALFIGFLVLCLGYLFLPILPLNLPSQEQFKSDVEVLVAATSVAEVWNVPKENVFVLGLHTDSYGSKNVAIINPETFSSASVWIPAPGVEHEHSLALLSPPDSDLHLLSEYTPQGPYERAIARNFFTRGWGKEGKVVIIHINTAVPFGEIRATSLTMGELRLPTFLIRPLFFSAIHFDY